MVGLKERYEAILNEALAAQSALALVKFSDQNKEKSKSRVQAVQEMTLAFFSFEKLQNWAFIQKRAMDQGNVNEKDEKFLKDYAESQVVPAFNNMLEAVEYANSFIREAALKFHAIQEDRSIIDQIWRDLSQEVIRLYRDKKPEEDITNELNMIRKRYEGSLLFYMVLRRLKQEQALSLDDLYQINRQKEKILESCEQKIASKPESAIDDINEQITFQMKQIQKEKIIKKRIWVLVPCFVLVINLVLFFFGKSIVSDWINAATCLVAGFMVAYNLMRNAFLLSSLSKIILSLQIGLGVGLLLIYLTSALLYPETFAWIANTIGLMNSKNYAKIGMVILTIDILIVVMNLMNHYIRYTQQLRELDELLNVKGQEKPREFVQSPGIQQKEIEMQSLLGDMACDKGENMKDEVNIIDNLKKNQ